MSQIVVRGITKKLSQWINGSMKDGDTYFRHFYDVTGSSLKFKAIYTISYSKVHNEGEMRNKNIGQVLKHAVKFLIGMPLLVPSVEPTMNTICDLLIEITSMHNGIIRLKYDVAVANGSFVHKKMIRAEELMGLVNHNLKHMYGISISDQYVTIDISKLNVEYRLVNIKDIYIKDNDCVLVYE